VVWVILDAARRGSSEIKCVSIIDFTVLKAIPIVVVSFKSFSEIGRSLSLA
jgi:hypothetical protein